MTALAEDAAAEYRAADQAYQAWKAAHPGADAYADATGARLAQARDAAEQANRRSE